LITFIIGGVRSGKSRFALQLANNYIPSKEGVHAISPTRKAYIATAEALDNEMKERIEQHKRDRGNDWVTYEESLEIAGVIERISKRCDVIVIDCLTLWVSNLIHRDLNVVKAFENLTTVLKNSKLKTQNSKLFIVSNEVGMGIVPENEMARRFRDMAGRLNQRVAEIADEVYMVVAGTPVKIKNSK
jgi:adenosylcobinamide kinase/adenosylcobinamide-phosphate guanylyltransferase